MFDIQKMLDNALEARRANEMKNSEQLTLIEIIMKLEAIKNKNLPVFFDETSRRPTEAYSWRGSYRELALGFTEEGSGDGFKTVSELLEDLKNAVGKTYEGYKGGDYLMGKTTPVWIANYGDSSGYRNGEIHTEAIVGVEEREDKAVLLTKPIEY